MIVHIQHDYHALLKKYVILNGWIINPATLDVAFLKNKTIIIALSQLIRKLVRHGFLENYKKVKLQNEI